MYTATIECDNNENLYRALKPEAVSTRRFTVTITQADNIKITINAQDATALKAITTSLTRLIETAEKIHGKK